MQMMLQEDRVGCQPTSLMVVFPITCAYAEYADHRRPAETTNSGYSFGFPVAFFATWMSPVFCFCFFGQGYRYVSNCLGGVDLLMVSFTWLLIEVC